MKSIIVHILSAFGKTPDGGNPAGVVLDADDLSEEEMLSISKEIGFSETAFVSRSDKADFQVRFFTPVEEVNMCGHATIATFSLMYQKNICKSGNYTQETEAGILPMEIRQNSFITMDQALPIFGETISVEIIQDIFDIPKKIVENSALKPQIVSTGLRDILLPIPSRAMLFSLRPDFQKMANYNKKTNTIGFHAFTLETIEKNSTAHVRNFAPLYDIPEEAATGSSNGALSCYLFLYKKLQNTKNLIFEQGYSMKKPSEIIVSLETKDNEITKVQVGGTAKYIEEKEIQI